MSLADKITSLDSFLAWSVALEEEAADRHDELADMMRGCGLEPVTWRPLTFGVATLYVGRKKTVGASADADDTSG